MVEAEFCKSAPHTFHSRIVGVTLTTLRRRLIPRKASAQLMSGVCQVVMKRNAHRNNSRFGSCCSRQRTTPRTVPLFRCAGDAAALSRGNFVEISPHEATDAPHTPGPRVSTSAKNAKATRVTGQVPPQVYKQTPGGTRARQASDRFGACCRKSACSCRPFNSENSQNSSRFGLCCGSERQGP